MNMKKTIAAVAACAMAVSAMATTVSAVDENATEVKSVHYDLTIKSKAKSATFTFTAKSITGANGTDPYLLEIYAPKSIVPKMNNKVTVTVADKSTQTSQTIVFNADSSAADYDGLASVLTDSEYDPNFRIYKESTAAAGAAAGGTIGDLVPFTTSLSDASLPAVKYDATKAADAKAIKGSVYKIEVPATSTIYKAFVAGGTNDLDVTVTMADVPVVSTATQGSVNTALVNEQTIGLKTMDTGAQKAVNARGTVTESEVKKPMKTTANTTTGTPGTIFNRLSTAGVRNVDGGFYQNAPAVINDMIANYDDVVFTFNTATDNVLSAEWLNGKESWIGNAANFADYYASGVPGVESWMGSDRYKSFPQDLYNLFGDEGTGYTYSDSYVFNNLFNAALIANNGYTMNQSSTQPFQYSATSVSFSWADMTGGNSYASVADTVMGLQLATSSLWYWDSMDVKAYELAAEDAGSGEGVDGDGDTIDDGEGDVDDSDIDDSDIDDSDIDDSDIDDTDVDTDVDADVDTDVDADVDADDTTPVENNPHTGNAPIALAVIPVALAAAAVVAKKRG